MGGKLEKQDAGLNKSNILLSPPPQIINSWFYDKYLSFDTLKEMQRELIIWKNNFEINFEKEREMLKALNLENMELNFIQPNFKPCSKDAYSHILLNLMELSEEMKTFLKKLGAFDFGPLPDFIDGTEEEDFELQILQDGHRYFGQYKNNLKHGKGVHLLPNKSIRIGWWKCGIATCRGRLVTGNYSVYEGEWHLGKAHGQGRCEFADGSIYQGHWKENLLDGLGVKVQPNGQEYRGCFKNGMQHGLGIMTFEDGSQYRGYFADNQINGNGEIVWINQKTYKGSWKDSLMHGRGEFGFEDGSFHIGYFENNQKQGYAQFSQPEGHKFFGFFENGREEGFGIFLSNDEVKYGEWKDGEIIRWIEQE